MNPHESQARAILAAITHVSNLLDGIVRQARREATAFSKERPDLTDYERRMLLAFVERARERMLDALGRLGLSVPEPRGCSACVMCYIVACL